MKARLILSALVAIVALSGCTGENKDTLKYKCEHTKLPAASSPAFESALKFQEYCTDYLAELSSGE